MKFRVFSLAITSLMLAVLSLPANADLFGRLETFEGSGVYQAYYDDALDITWLADANFAKTETFGVSGISSVSGSMRWGAANNWIDGMNNYDSGAGWLGISDWRMPTTSPVDGSLNFNMDFTFDGSTDVAYNISELSTIYAGSAASEMAYMFFNNLNGLAGCAPDSPVGECTAPTTFGLVNGMDVFQNIQSAGYWTGLVSAANSSRAWSFSFTAGNQATLDHSNRKNVWAVTDGDVAVMHTPVPAAIWLFGSGLLALVGIGRRVRRGCPV